jgi:hypothetical protein
MDSANFLAKRSIKSPYQRLLCLSLSGNLVGCGFLGRLLGSSLLFPCTLHEIEGQNNNDEQDVCGDTADGLGDSALQRLGVVHHVREILVAVNEDQRAGRDQLGARDQDTRDQNADDGQHGGQFVEANGDLELEGEIVGYDITPMAVTSNASSAETRLTLRIRVRYTNNTNHEEDYERTYSAYRNFDSAQLITDVQDALIEELVEEICEHIYNDTVANW